MDEYREILKKLVDWDDFLRTESNLPGPRGNLELAHAAADLEGRERIEHFLSFTPQIALVNTPDYGQRCAPDNEGKPEEKPVDQNGQSLGGGLPGANRRLTEK